MHCELGLSDSEYAQALLNEHGDDRDIVIGVKVLTGADTIVLFSGIQYLTKLYYHQYREYPGFDPLEPSSASTIDTVPRPTSTKDFIACRAYVIQCIMQNRPIPFTSRYDFLRPLMNELPFIALGDLISDIPEEWIAGFGKSCFILMADLQAHELISIAYWLTQQRYRIRERFVEQGLALCAE